MTSNNDPNACLLRAERARNHGERAVSAFLAARSLKRELLAEFRAAWEAGRPAGPEDLLVRWPGDVEADPDVASLLYEDYCQRQCRGEQPDPEAYVDRFPGQGNSLASMAYYHAVLQSLGASHSDSGLMLALPTVGEELFGYRLVHELGRGSFARVFLAEQTVLGGRPVVVKVSAIDGDEPCTLARLQHTHIMPIYSVHEDVSAGVRAVCMPYFGGASLSQVLRALGNEADLPTRGKQLAEALSAVSGPRAFDGALRNPDQAPLFPHHENAAPGQSPAAVLAGLTYVRAVAWIGARLAEALEHAHQRGVLHRDLKPSNILLGADGQPMLLDFNLAQTLRTSSAQGVATLGGTVAYMAPEHLRALATRNPVLARQVDQRADIYGLGMVLYEMLTRSRAFDRGTGQPPVPALMEAMADRRSQSIPSLRGCRRDVPWSLESILRKCLLPDPDERYHRADHLAEDLRRFLEDRPLRYAPELSWAERLTKWVRRHPRLAVVGPVVTAAGLLLTIGGVILALTSVQLDRGRNAEAREVRRRFGNDAQLARCLIEKRTGFQDGVAEGVGVCERALAYYGVLDGSGWQKPEVWHRLGPEDQRLVTEEVRELLVLLAWGQVYLAPSRADPDLPRTLAASLATLAPATRPQYGLAAWAGGPSIWEPKAQVIQEGAGIALKKALGLLDRAESIDGFESSRALSEARSFYLEKLGDLSGAAAAQKRAGALTPASARDHYLLASHHLLASGPRSFEYERAVRELKEALRLDPRHYSSRLLLVDCYCELREYALALSECGACIVLWPEFAWGYFNLGRVLQELGKREEAIEAYTAALIRHPAFGDVYQNRGLLYLDVKKNASALADFERALELGHDNVVVRAGRGIALENLGRFAEADQAFQEAWAQDSRNLHMRLGYAFAISRRRPEDAWATFLEVLEIERLNSRAHYGCGMLSAHESRSSEAALESFSSALVIDPSFVEARRARANVLAHRGACEAALQDIGLCVKTDPRGVTLYAAACVYALCVDQYPEPWASTLAESAIALLREAINQGYGVKIALTDSDLSSIWKHPQFPLMLQEASRPKQAR